MGREKLFLSRGGKGKGGLPKEENSQGGKGNGWVDEKKKPGRTRELMG